MISPHPSGPCGQLLTVRQAICDLRVPGWGAACPGTCTGCQSSSTPNLGSPRSHTGCQSLASLYLGLLGHTKPSGVPSACSLTQALCPVHSELPDWAANFSFSFPWMPRVPQRHSGLPLGATSASPAFAHLAPLSAVATVDTAPCCHGMSIHTCRWPASPLLFRALASVTAAPKGTAGVSKAK